MASEAAVYQLENGVSLPVKAGAADSACIPNGSQANTSPTEAIVDATGLHFRGRARKGNCVANAMMLDFVCVSMHDFPAGVTTLEVTLEFIYYCRRSRGTAGSAVLPAPRVAVASMEIWCPVTRTAAQFRWT